MAERDRPAVDVDFLGIELELPRHGDGSDRKGFIEFNEIDILVAVPTGLREKFFHRLDRRHHHPLRLNAAHGLCDNPRNRLLAQP